MKVAIAYIFLFFGLGINYLFNVFVARQLGPDDFGHYSYALYLFNIFSLIAVAGLDEAALRFIPQSYKKNEDRSAIQFIALLASIFFMFIYCAFIWFFLKESNKTVSYIFALSLPLFVFITVNTAILQANHIVGPRMAFRYALEPILKILLFFIFTKHTISIIDPAYAIFSSLFLTNLAAVMVYHKRLLVSGFIIIRDNVDRLIKFIMPMLAYNVINVVSGRVDVLILGALAVASDVGQYSAAFQTAAMLAIVLQGIETVYAPIFSTHIGKGNFASLNEDYRHALRWTMLISSPVIVEFILYPELALMPFGEQYSEAKDILAILCVSQIINLATGSANAILLAMGKVKIVLLNSIAYVIASIAFVGCGAYLKGGEGAAIGVVGAIVVLNLLRVLYVYKISGCHPFSVAYYKIIAALILTLGVGVIANPYIKYAGLLLNPTVFVVLIIVFGLHKDDKQMIKCLYARIFKRMEG